MSRNIPRPNLEPLLSPKSIAVIGASRDIVKMGGRCIAYPLRHGYRGHLYPVNPKADEVMGLPAYSSVLEIPEPVDAAMVVVASKYVLPVLEQCAEKGIGAAIILSSGFAESGEGGKQLQSELKDFAVRTGMRLCGPNSNGLLNVHEQMVATSNPTLEADLLPGRIAVVSQSGGLGLGSILYLGQKRHIGFSYHVSSGNEVDLEAADYVHYLLDDPHTDVFALLVEGLKDADKFAVVADKAAARGKPIILLKLGRTATGSDMVASHTALLAGSDRVNQALFEQKGVIQVEDFDDLYEVAALFSRMPLPQSGGVGVISPSGGAAILAADLCSELGLTTAELEPETVQGLAATLPDFAAIRNPLDLTAVGTSDPTIYPTCLKLMINDRNVHLMVLCLTVNANYDSLMTHIVEVAGTTPKPILCIGAGDGLSGRGFEILEEGQVPLFRSFTKGFKAVRHLIQYAEFQRARAAGHTQPVAIVGHDQAAEKALSLLAGRSGGQTEALSKQILRAYDISTTTERLVTSEADAVAAAQDIGFPVVLKGMSPQLLHKTDTRLVRLNLATAEDISRHYNELAEQIAVHPGADFEGVLVQEMVPDGVELIIGLYQDQQFGSTILFGLGGIFVEVLDDVMLRVAPLSKRDVETMIWGINGAVVLKGVRGRPSVDTDALTDLLLRVSQMATDLEGSLVELDLNPVRVFGPGDGLKVLDALAVLS
jgi:acetyltransferase